MAEFIRIEHLNKSYHDRPVLQDLSLSIPIGQITAVMAPSGVGKTTLLRILMGLETADSGKIEGLDGLRLSAVFQEDRLCEEYSAVKNLEMVMGDAKEAREVLARLLPEEALERPCHELSGGMKRRVSLVRAMEAGAQCVLLDEPFTGLDEENREKAYEYIRTHARGRIIMIATHIRPLENTAEDGQKGDCLWKKRRETRE